ncbi:sodium:glutamate symporter [bacterium]|nr:sodium:glutamate symporter [bacterium]
MNFSWHVFINLGVISIAMLFATLIRAKVKFFQKYLIPNALTAGFLALPFYNFILPHMGLNSIQLGEITYHFLGLSFIPLTLRQAPKKTLDERTNHYAFPTAISIVSQMAFQAFIGIGLTLLYIRFVNPDLFHSFGFLLPLGFSQGPGQAFSIGESWQIYGIQNAGNIGVTFAAIGFVICSFGGIFLINTALRKGWISEQELVHMRQKGTQTGIRPQGEKRDVGAYLSTDTEAMDSFSLHMALVLTAYFMSWLLLKGLGVALGWIGPMGAELAANLWGLNFIFAAFMGLLLKKILQVFKVDYITDNRTLTRVSGLSVDIMVTSAVAAISLGSLSGYWLEILTLAAIGGISAFYGTIWFCSRLFEDHRFLRTLLIYGVSTGTLSTGLALLRAVDPEFESPVAVDYTYASGLTFFMVIPIILIIPLPLQTFKTGDWTYSWITLGVLALYLVFVLISYFVIAKKRALGQKNHIWFRPNR